MSISEANSGASGTWTIAPGTPTTTITISDGSDPDMLGGDTSGDTPFDPTQTYNGEFIYYEVVRTYTDQHGNTYTGMVFEYDIDGNGDIDAAVNGTSNEESYFIAWIPNGFDPNDVTLASLGPGPVPPDGSVLTATSSLSNASSLTIVCLSSDTLVRTPVGAVRLADICSGDLIETQSGPQNVRWIGRRRFSNHQIRQNPAVAPVRITAGSMGPGLPKRDLLVSRQHRMLISSTIAERMFGQRDVLVAAIKLAELPGIYVDTSVESIEYVHILFDQHEIIFAEGAPTESLFTGPEALEMIPPEAKAEILEIFPNLDEENKVPAAALIPSNRKQRTLVGRLSKNRKMPLQ